MAALGSTAPERRVSGGPRVSSCRGNGLDSDGEQLTWRRLWLIGLSLPAVIAGFLALVLLNQAYTRVLGGDARGQLAVPALIVACAALTTWLRWDWAGPPAAGLVAGAAVAVAASLAMGSLFPSNEAITDSARARVADQHLAALEQSPEFVAAPPGLTLVKAARQRGCSDWFDRREPQTWRQFELSGSTSDDVAAFYRQRWTAAGFTTRDGAWVRTIDGLKRPGFRDCSGHLVTGSWAGVV